MRRALAALVLAACSSGSTGHVPSPTECADLESEIRRKAIALGYDGDNDGTPDAKGVCGSTNPKVRAEVGELCDRFLACK